MTSRLAGRIRAARRVPVAQHGSGGRPAPCCGWSGLLFGLLLVATSPLAAQNARISNSIDTTLVRVGDRVRLTVAVEHDAGARVVWPDSLDLTPFEVLAAEGLPSRTTAGRVQSTVVLTLTAFELGEIEIPSFDVEVVGPGDARQVVATDRFGVEVVTVGMDEGDGIRDIRGPLGIPVGVVIVSLWILLVFGAALVAYLLYRRFRQRADGGLSEPVVPVRPPHEIALEALARVEASALLERGQVKEYHIEVSEIVRGYVEATFGVPSLEMTTREVLTGLRTAGVDAAFRDGLQRFLEQCDMVKFAKVRPTSDSSVAVLALGRDVVRSSIPEAPEARSSAEADVASSSESAAGSSTESEVEAMGSPLDGETPVEVAESVDDSSGLAGGP